MGGSITIITQSSAGYDAWLLRTDGTGQFLWSVADSVGSMGTAYDEIRELQVTPDGGYVFCGWAWLSGSADPQIYLVKTDENGKSGCNEKMVFPSVYSPAPVMLPANTQNSSLNYSVNNFILLSSINFADSVLCSGLILPVPKFDVGDTVICVNECIDFTDKSTNGPTLWNWTFQGGTPSTSTLQNPLNICYNTAGTYSVTLDLLHKSYNRLYIR